MERSDAKAVALTAENVQWLDEVFKYHPVEAGQVERYAAVRGAGKQFATVIMLNCPPSADRTAALRKIREAVMTANASIALKGRV